MADFELGLLDSNFLSEALAQDDNLEIDFEDIDDSPECPHLTYALSTEATRVAIRRKLKAAVAWAATTLHDGGRPLAKRRKVSMPSCGTCGQTLHRPFICLECSYGGCWSKSHVREHLKETGHGFCADVKSGAVFCSKCDDFILNQGLDNLYHETILHCEEKLTRVGSLRTAREPYEAWLPNDKETSALLSTKPSSCTGQRGLLNLGQTCYMNAVLQALTHNPLLRNYFLSDKHNNQLCKGKPNECMCCEMDKLFTEVYSPTNTPFAPATFLATTWRVSPQLAGYAQHDAHEFFSAVLDHMHASARGSTASGCNCVVHSVFAGQQQSDVRCARCGVVKSTSDLTLDLNLEIGGRGAEATLLGCLRKYTQVEKLSSKYTCDSCGSTHQNATKQLTVRKLPPVLGIQLKRFEHKSGDKTAAKKITTHIRFPSTLDMAPYTTLAAGMHPESKSTAEGADKPRGPQAMCEYDLFAVVNHEGQLDKGHYTSFVRSGDEWYRFDDDKSTHTSLESVLAASAYMLFYVKRHLDYKPYTRPSYIVTREVEAVKEKEKEREEEAARMKEVEDALLATV